MNKFFILVLEIAVITCARPPLLPAQESDGEQVLKSYLYTFPDRVQGVHDTGVDWTIRVGDRTFYWAGGRLLPQELLQRGNLDWQKYRPHSFGVYPLTVPDPRDYSAEEIEALRIEGSAEARLEADDTNRDFQAALYGGITRAEVERNLVRVTFLGKSIVVHTLITEALDRVDRAIRNAAEQDRETAAFIASIGSIGCYNWRDIRGTQRMSYHSWGLAVDIQPGNLGNRAIYWLWERVYNADWMLVPPAQRWNPPDAVVRAFENEGFIWGGKWSLYDNMHFEFRPEQHELNRLLLASGQGEINIIKSENMPDLHHIYPGTETAKTPGPKIRGLIERIRGLPTAIHRTWSAFYQSALDFFNNTL
ncbi:hypothetical protein FACS1894141_2790 [Spirochaetia bacterium]|nr:hypothetical protein FACS1894141_2790 [Spirochaetia bacterium]